MGNEQEKALLGFILRRRGAHFSLLDQHWVPFLSLGKKSKTSKTELAMVGVYVAAHCVL